MSAVVVYVHGLWLSGREALFLRRRLAHEFDFDVRTFRYPAVSGSMVEIAEQLQTFVAEIRPQALHLIGHSLGGLIAYRFLERFPEQPPGRVVFLGTPAVASRAASEVSRMHWARPLLGHCVAEELLAVRRREWTSPRDLGIIAGTVALGLGQLFVEFDEPSDGSVAVSETRLPGATAHLTLPVNHFGMLLSERVARETGSFLARGHFSHATP